MWGKCRQMKMSALSAGIWEHFWELIQRLFVVDWFSWVRYLGKWRVQVSTHCGKMRPGANVAHEVHHITIIADLVGFEEICNE